MGNVLSPSENILFFAFFCHHKKHSEERNDDNGMELN